MRWSVRRQLTDWLDALSQLGGYRGMVVLHSSSPAETGAVLAGLLGERLGDGICIAPAETRRPLREYCGRVLSPAAIEELLGTENSYVVLVVPRLLRPNLLAAAAETVRAGGVVALVAPPLEAWSPGGASSIGAYKRYLVNRLSAARSLFWASSDDGTVYVMRLPSCCARRPEPATGYQPRSPLPRRLVEAAATREQAEALDEIAGFLRRRGRSVLVIGDRGRGKSGLLGLVAAYLASSHMVGFAPVTGPTLYSVQSFFRVLDAALDRLGVRHWVIRRGGQVLGVAGPWFHFRYHTPDQVHPGSFTFIDEAAAVGPTRLRAIAARCPRLLAASTIHGYEGSGRVLAHMAEKILPEPRLRIELRTPVRYPPGDPVEEWVYDTFMLRAEPPPPPREGVGETVVERLDRLRLAEDYGLLRAVYSILVTAHYRNEPDDLALLLDAPHHMLYVLRGRGGVVAAADVAVEDEDTPWDARILYDRLAEAVGVYRRLRGWRVVRIAVHPELQRRGLGTGLLRGIEADARRAGVDWLGAIYGRPAVTPFWLHNGFLPVYVSPLPSKATGEHNVAVAKPLSPNGRRTVVEAASDLLARLIWGLGSLYRSLDSSVAAQLLAGSPLLADTLPKTVPHASQVKRLRRVAAGQAEPESALDALHAAAASVAGLFGGLWPLGGEERLVLAARVMQGKTPRELRHLLGAETLRGLLQAAASELLLYLAPVSPGSLGAEPQ